MFTNSLISEHPSRLLCLGRCVGEFIGIEREQDFYNIAQARITHEAKKPKQQTFEF